jgi:uncharacterized protein (TIGR02145 family)
MERKIFRYFIVLIASFSFSCSESPTETWDNSTFTDIDGNVYGTITIGDQIWMSENLKVTRYRNGDSIENVTDSTEWASLISGAYCFYNNDNNNIETYGLLYNWYAINDTRNIAPESWHVPTDLEWRTLILFLGDNLLAGGKLKEPGIAHWLSPNNGANNQSEFTALPGGCRIFYNGLFKYIYERGYWWSSSEVDLNSAWYRALFYEESASFRSYNDKRSGFSVRLISD